MTAISTQTIREYLNSFRIHLSRRLRPGTGMVSRTIPVGHGAAFVGAVIELTLGANLLSEDKIEDAAGSFASALNIVPQRAFGGNIANFVFTGTNTIVEGNRIVLIKDGDIEQWSEDAARADAARILRRQ